LFGEASAAMITELPQVAVKFLFESLKLGLTNERRRLKKTGLAARSLD
jgi:hypothetical protein